MIILRYFFYTVQKHIEKNTNFTSFVLNIITEQMDNLIRNILKIGELRFGTVPVEYFVFICG